jgi:hypothetical protein
MITTIADTRPNRLTQTKDEKYHLSWGRYAIWAGYNNPIHTLWINRVLTHEQFYIGNQWFIQEDIENFLKDESGDVRNRLQVRMNMIRKIMMEYIGNASRMTLNAEAFSVSPLTKTRRDEQLAKMLFQTELARKVPVFADAIREKTGVGKTNKETEQIFDNVYVDKFVEALNYLMQYIAQINDLESLQPFIAEQIGLSGLGVLMDYEYAGEQRFKAIQSKDFFWDRNSRDYALQNDCQFQGHFDYMAPPQIYEMYPHLSEEQRLVVESYDKRQPAATSVGYQQNVSRNGVPVANVYWRDTEPQEFGYVINEYGDTVFKRINHTPEGEKRPTYTDKDLIDPTNTYESRRRMRGKKSVTIYPDVIRYVRFVPYQAAPDQSPQDRKPDLVLEYGVMPYQEANNEKYNTVPFPYKTYCWSYINGEVRSPLEDAIDSQRFVNRVLSVVDEQIRNTGGSGPIVDSSVFLTTEEEMDAKRDMQHGRPVSIDARGRGIQNVVGQYDMNPKNGLMNMFNILEAIKGLTQYTIGTNEAMQGQSMGQDQLVGVTELMIQRGSLLQEPFYNAVTKIFMQAYQSMAVRGKKIYIDNPNDLTIAVGDAAAKVISLSKDMEIEDFRVSVKRANAQEELHRAADAMLLQLLQLGLIDQRHFGNLFGRSTPDQVAAAIREYSKERQVMAKMQMQQQQAQSQQQMALFQQMNQQQQQNILDERNDKHLVQAQKHVNDLEKIEAKAQAASTYPKAAQQKIVP